MSSISLAVMAVMALQAVDAFGIMPCPGRGISLGLRARSAGRPVSLRMQVDM